MLHVISTDYTFQDIGVELALGCTALVMSTRESTIHAESRLCPGSPLMPNYILHI